MAKRKETDTSVTILLEHSRMNREKSLLVLDKALLLYLYLVFLAVVGFVAGYLDARLLNVMIVLGFGVLAVGIIPYLITMSKEEKRLKELLRQHGGKK